MYFKGLVDIIVNRAELIGAERRMMKVRRDVACNVPMMEGRSFVI